MPNHTGGCCGIYQVLSTETSLIAESLTRRFVTRILRTDFGRGDIQEWYKKELKEEGGEDRFVGTQESIYYTHPSVKRNFSRGAGGSTSPVYAGARAGGCLLGIVSYSSITSQYTDLLTLPQWEPRDITLVYYQMSFAKNPLLKAGWSLVTAGRNPNTSRTINVLTYGPLTPI